ncbi:SPP1 family holin [Clostridiales Family XIII bacterium PM5-7]
MNKGKISAGTIARLIVLIVALLNQVCAILGWTPLELSEETVYQLCTLGFTVGSALVAFWKNNSFTQAAIGGDNFKEHVKAMLRLDENYLDNRKGEEENEDQ